MCDFEHPDGKDTFWHSSSHMLGSSLESLYGVDLTTGPATDGGYYYDCFTGNNEIYNCLVKILLMLFFLCQCISRKRYNLILARFTAELKL